MTDRPGLLTPARVLRPPASISDAAQARLAAYSEMAAEPQWPDVADAASWKAMVRQIDAQMLAQVAPYLPNCRDRVEHFLVGETAVQTATPQDELNPGAVYLDIHGGGFTCFGGDVCRAFGRLLSARLGITVWSPDYRLPPDHPFPTGLSDLMQVYTHLLQRVSADKVIVGGQSTGGNLALALVLKAKASGLALPAGLVLLTPHIDLTESGDSFQILKGVDPGLPYTLNSHNRLYAGEALLSCPEVSPLFADFDAAFPATFLQAGTRDLLLSNAVRLHRRMRKAGVYVDLQLYEAMPHGGFGGSPEDGEADDDLRAFLSEALNRYDALKDDSRELRVE